MSDPKIHKVTLLMSDDYLKKIMGYVKILHMTDHWMPDDLPDQALVQTMCRAMLQEDDNACVIADTVLMDVIGFKPGGKNEEGR